LDDALAMTLYGVGTSIAQLISGGEASILHELTKLCIEVGGAVVVGIVGGLSLNKLLRFDHEPEHRLAMATGILLLVIGVCRAFDMDIIIATMTVGILLVNLAPRRSHDLFALIRSFTSPIYVMFFVLVGARLALGQMPAWLWIVAAVYVVGRSAGKYIGAYLGATASKAEPVVRNCTGLGLFAQGGVAVGLSIMAGAHLNHLHVSDGMPLGDMIVYVVTATTLVVQIIGPPLVKLAARRAGELDRDITVKDVIGQWNVNDVLETDIIPVPEGEPLSAVVQRFSESDHLVYPVVGDEDRLVGVLSLEDMKDVLPDRDTWDWLLAGDVATPPREHVTPDTKLKVALDLMADLDLEQIPVVSGDHEKPVGILDRRKAHRKAHEKVLRLQR